MEISLPPSTSASLTSDDNNLHYAYLLAKMQVKLIEESFSML